MTQMKTDFAHEGPSENAAGICQALTLRPMFWRPNYLETSAWLEHIPFAFWLMAAHQPKVFVELGSHYGVSYFAFCQAAERLGLDTRCFAVDTWKGDEHAGFYDDKVFAQVRAHNDAHYSGFSRLVRSTFDDALGHFSDGSIDLLHIDGLHTYEAVKHDYEGWLPKLSENAVIIMHDTNVRERGFGVFKLFEELKEKYPAFEFVHGHGLGLLAKNPEQNPMLQRLFEFESNKTAKPVVQEMFSRLGRACADSLAAERNQATANKFKSEVNKHTKQIEELKQALEKTKTDFTNRSKELNETKAKLQKQAEENAGERAQLIERATLLDQLRKELKEDVTRLQARNDQLEIRATSHADELHRAEIQVFSHKSALGEAEVAHQKQLTSLQLKMTELNERDEERNKKLKLLQSQLSILEAENSALKLDKIQEQERLQNEVLTQQAALEQMRLSGEQKNAVLQKAEQEIARLAAENTQLRIDLEEISVVSSQHAPASSETISNEVEELRKTNAELSSRCKKLAESVDVRFQELAKLTQMLSAKDKAIRARMEETAHLVKKLAAVEHTRKELQQSSEKIRAQLRNAEQELLKLNEQLRLSQNHQAESSEKLRETESTLCRTESDLQQVLQKLARSAVLPSVTGAKQARLIQFANKIGVQKLDRREEKLARQADLLKRSGLFDENWYLNRYPDVQQSTIDPAVHYLRFGAAENRDPGPFFSTERYIKNYPDVAESKINPLVHYINHGSKEARTIHGPQAK